MKKTREKKLRFVSWIAGLLLFMSTVLMTPIQASACAGCRACEMGTTCGCGCKMAETTAIPAARADERVVDPVCGMKVNPENAKKKGLTYQWQGRTYYFCMKGDLEKFKANPEKYTSGAMHHGKTGKDMCSQMNAIHDEMMKAYAEVMDLMPEVKKRAGVKNANSFYKSAEAFMNSMHKMHMQMGDEGMKMMKSHHSELMRTFESLKRARKSLNSAITSSQRKKALTEFKKYAEMFAAHMDRAHDMAMKHMSDEKYCGGKMKKGHGHH